MGDNAVLAPSMRQSLGLAQPPVSPTAELRSSIRRYSTIGGHRGDDGAPSVPIGA
jgi:hypothetical protein